MQEPSRRSRLPRTVLLLGFVSLLADISSEMTYPLVPLLLAGLGGGPALLGLIEGSAEMLASLTGIYSGRYTDRTGRRRPWAIGGYGLAALGKGLISLATGWPLLLTGRLADRFGKGLRGAPRNALLADAVTADQRGRAFGFHRAMDTAGALLGVAIAYVLLRNLVAPDPATLRRIFALAVVPALLSVAVLAFVREPTSGSGAAKAAQPGLRAGWRQLDGRLRQFLIFSFVFALGNASNQFLLLRASGLGFDPAQVLLLYGFYNLTYVLGAYPAGWLSDRIGRRWLLVAGYGLYAATYVGMAVANRAVLLWPLFGLYGLYSACTDGVEKALLIDLAPTTQRATVLGLHGAMQGLGLLPASLLAGGLWQWLGPRVSFGTGALAGSVAALAMLLILRPQAAPQAG